MGALDFLQNATAQVAAMRDDINLSLHILEVRDELRALDVQFVAKQAELAAFMALPHGGRRPNSTMLLDHAQNLTADSIRIRSYMIPLQNKLRELERQQRGEA